MGGGEGDPGTRVDLRARFVFKQRKKEGRRTRGVAESAALGRAWLASPLSPLLSFRRSHSAQVKLVLRR